MPDPKNVYAALKWAMANVRWKIDCEGFCCRHCKSSTARMMNDPIKHAAGCPYARALAVLEVMSKE